MNPGEDCDIAKFEVRLVDQNGGVRRGCEDLSYAVKIDRPGKTEVENVPPLGRFLRDVMKSNMDSFRVFAPDENTSNKLDAIYEVSKKFWIAESFQNFFETS